MAKLLLRSDLEHGVYGCWLWQGYKDAKGYGQIRVGKKIMWVHRVSYAFFRGEIKEGMSIEHKCRNHHCINPAHLIELSVKDNTYLENDRRRLSKIKVGEEKVPF